MTLLFLSTAFLTGVFSAAHVQASVPALALFAVASVLMLALILTFRRSAFPALLLLTLLLGMLRMETFDRDGVSALAVYHSRLPVAVTGVVSSDPEAAGTATRFRLRVNEIRRGDPSEDVTDGRSIVLVTLRETAELVQRRARPYFRYGDRLLLEGPLSAPPDLEDFDYPSYLARQGIGSVMSFPKATLLGEGEGSVFYRWLYGLRRRIGVSLARVVPEPQASVGQALLLGIREDVPEEMVDDFRATGASHLLAISGLHVGVLLAVSMGVSVWGFGRRRNYYLLLPFVLMWLYAPISGMSPSVTRAAIMGTVYLAALLLGRPRSALPALGFATAVMVAVNPNVLWSVSFQLSFAAVTGIALLATRLGEWATAKYEPRFPAEGLLVKLLTPVAYAVAVTVAATFATLPLIAFYFQRISLVGLPTTLLTLPALPLILVSQALAGLIGLLSTTVAQPFGWLAWLATEYLTTVVSLMARIPGASTETGRLAPVLVGAYYGTLLLLLARGRLHRMARWFATNPVRWSRSSPLLSRGVPLWVLTPVLTLAALMLIAALSRPNHMLRVAFVDVGEGDAAFITTPGGDQVLVDGGLDTLNAVRFLGERMPFRDRTIELVVLTHGHGDHINGLIEVLQRYEVERILERETVSDGAPYTAWRRAVAEEGAAVIQAEPGQVISIGGGAFIQVIGPPATLLRGTSSDANNSSVVVRLVYGDVRFLLTGDMAGEAEAVLVNGDVPIDSEVLKVGHHGSRTSSSAAFLDRVRPVAAVISVNSDSRYGHPHEEVMEELRKRLPEELLLLTRDRGTIEFVTDGKTLSVTTER